MRGRIETVVVAGDISLDWLYLELPPENDVGDSAQGSNWQLKPGMKRIWRPGGALLLAEMVRNATTACTRVLSLQIVDLEKKTPDEVLHSIVELKRFPYSDEEMKKERYRALHLRGFVRPEDGKFTRHPVSGDDPRAGLLVLDDAAADFREQKSAWPQALSTSGDDQYAILKMSRPLAEGPLWKAATNHYRERLVTVVSANDLRDHGLRISRRLSWEQTATDLVRHLKQDSRWQGLIRDGHLVVMFGIDGALHLHPLAGRSRARLYYDRSKAEGDFCKQYPGTMLGFTNAFVGGLVAQIVRRGSLEGVGEGIRDGLCCARRLMLEGFGRNESELCYPTRKIFASSWMDRSSEAAFADVLVPDPVGSESWSVLEEFAGPHLTEMAQKVVIHGHNSKLQSVPVGEFGNLTSVDRTEIEGYRSIENLMQEYLAKPKPKRPLSIAVFGPPGSGKSFGVTQIAESLAGGEVQTLEFNLSQFEGSQRLVRALHRVRDETLGRKIPVVFFDEFDSRLGEAKLGWLKYFLSPMQDGEFRDGEALHPIGKAIFVFAGGTTSSYDAFYRRPPESSQHDPVYEEFRDAKGPDFVSRLRGFVNILGPNPTEETENLHVIRRAMILRSLLKRSAPQLFDADEKAQIDLGVLSAMLEVSSYHHGIRSMEAIIDMSMLAGRKKYEKAALPSKAQLDLHVKAESFLSFVDQASNAGTEDLGFAMKREQLAKALHAQYRQDQKNNKDADDPAMQPWQDLKENLKKSNRESADKIPALLQMVGLGFSSEDRPNTPKILELTDDQIETMAEREHRRWTAERRLDGWVFGPRDPETKQSDLLLPWSDLSDAHKQWNYDMVRAIPQVMKGVGLRIYRKQPPRL